MAVPRSSPAEQPPERRDWLDHLLRLQTHFGRFVWDILGLVSLALALMTFLGLLNLSQGEWMTWWVNILRMSFGWGSIFVILSLAVFGLYALSRSRHAVAIPWGRIIALELFAFLSLAVLAMLSGNRLSLAEAGQWGGRVGWALSSMLAEVLGPVWSGALLLLLWILSLVGAFDLWKFVERWILEEAGEAPLPGLVSSATSREQETSSAGPSPSPASSASKAPPQARPLPPEYRKNFKIPERQERSTESRPRSEDLPPLNLLMDEQGIRPDERTINQTAGLIEKTLAEFGIPAKVIGFRIGPTVTQYAVQPGFIRKGNEEDAQQMKVRVAQIAALQKDLALALAAERLRIEAPVPGRNYVGIEVPNARSALVRLRPLLESEAFNRLHSPLAIALGRDVSGNPLVADLTRMPHLLVAGTTGSGKSVCLIALATCLAMNNSPEELRMVMIDSKMVELIRFNGLPHLYGKVETDIQRILGVLRWVVVEMEHRYQLLEAAKARDIDAYNRRLSRRKEAHPLPRIVVIIDELADLMMSAPDQTEHNLVRLAQMARATGIHLVVATQRPSTDVVTGLIKANFPARIAFAVASHVDSRVILDLPGAENLLGRGDMLFLNPEVGNPIRAQGVLVNDQEIERLIAYWQKVRPPREAPPPWETMVHAPDDKTGDDVLLERAITLLKKERRASASLLQRKLNIGYPRAARLLDQLEEMGVVGPAVGAGREREVLLEPDENNGENGET
ncbi:MAG: DNA translocase FtsK [Anaerolineales bacterium]|nr:DNA translocase FtsK [Anaerolineales bacterium]MCX7609149.1 DNA translocase FtsK [Anaerolineales bacterium]MDW8227531.1 DNA translocase FtsK [Anaerolineales bacterium]